MAVLKAHKGNLLNTNKVILFDAAERLDLASAAVLSPKVTVPLSVTPRRPVSQQWRTQQDRRECCIW